jgi:hypothetical protein
MLILAPAHLAFLTLIRCILKRSTVMHNALRLETARSIDFFPPLPESSDLRMVALIPARTWMACSCSLHIKQGLEISNKFGVGTTISLSNSPSPSPATAHGLHLPTSRPKPHVLGVDLCLMCSRLKLPLILFHIPRHSCAVWCQYRSPWQTMVRIP